MKKVLNFKFFAVAAVIAMLSGVLGCTNSDVANTPQYATHLHIEDVWNKFKHDSLLSDIDILCEGMDRIGTCLEMSSDTIKITATAHELNMSDDLYGIYEYIVMSASNYLKQKERADSGKSVN